MYLVDYLPLMMYSWQQELPAFSHKEKQLTTDFDSRFNSIAAGQRKAVGVMSVISALIALVVGAGIVAALLVFAGTTKGVIILSVVVGVIAVLVAVGSLVSGLMFNKFQKSMFS